MKNFLKSTLAAFIGAFIAMVIIPGIFFFIAVVGLVIWAGSSTETEIKDNSVLVIDLNKSYGETEPKGTDQFSLLKDRDQVCLISDVVKAIEKAKKSPKIKGLIIHGDNYASGLTTARELRQAIAKFKGRGKFVYSYSDNPLQGSYYIQSVADSVFINPYGQLDLHGLSSNTLYYKKALEKLGIDVQVFRVGSFKSAVEPFINDEMSPENRLQTATFLNSIWNVVTADIAHSRNLSQWQIKQLADSMIMMDSTKTYIDNHLVDKVCYQHEFEDIVRDKLNIEDDDDIPQVSYAEVNDIISDEEADTDDIITVLHCEGEIDSSSDEGIVADDVISTVEDLIKDDNVQALVLRINSPGGSAYDSEQIWEILEHFKESTAKPLIVSMGSVAASGGYYISVGADRIFAESTTLTGSIGVFGMVPCVEKLATNVGLNVQTVSTSKNNTFDLLVPLNDVQKAGIQKSINHTYELFTSRCAQGRGIPVDSIKKIAEGRVWDGLTAKKIGLVDEIGGLDKAIACAAKLAGLKQYRLEVLPEPKDYSTRLFEAFKNIAVKCVLPENMQFLLHQQKILEKIIHRDHIQTITEVEVTI